MRIWLITVGEPLPLPNSTDRPWRTGLLAEELALRGHEVLWWVSNVDHFNKTSVFSDEPKIQLKPGISLRFLSGRLYRRNVSLSRLRNHVELGERFRLLSREEMVPDVILCSFPTIELALESVQYASDRGLPIILDVRDLWPDIFLDILPVWARKLGRIMAGRLFRNTKAALMGATAIFAVSSGYLRWGLDVANRSVTELDGVFPLGYKVMTGAPEDESSLLERLSMCGAEVSGVLVSFVGTFGRTYDLATVISAARIINETNVNTMQFILCGSGENELKWKDLARDVPNVTFPGWLPAKELARLLERTTIGLAAYAGGAPQGIPNKVIEYMSASLPVVCSLSGESKELIESNGCGLYYPAGDAETLAQSLMSLVSSPERLADMRAASRRIFEDRFSSSTVYCAMADQLEQVVAKHRIGPRYTHSLSDRSKSQ